MSAVKLLQSSQFSIVEATSFEAPNASGFRRYRLLLNGPTDYKTKILARNTFIGFIYFMDVFLAILGRQRRWIKLCIYDINTDSEKIILLSINSLCNRTLLSRKDILSKTAKELSSFLTSPEKILFSYKKIKDFFPNSLLINLDRKKDRLQSFQQHLRAIDQSDLSYQRFPAVDGKNFTSEELSCMSKSGYAQRTGKDDRAGRLGVFHSQLNAIKFAKKHNYPNVLILEDDVRFRPEYFSGNYVQKAMHELPKNWGILYLGHYDVEKSKSQNYSDNLVIPGRPYDCHAWVINASMYDQLITTFEKELQKKNGKIRAVDVVVGKTITEKNKGRVFAMKDNIAIQDEGYSSILNQKIKGSYQKELASLKKKIPESTPLVKNKTLEGMPVMDPLLVGTLYQMMSLVDVIFLQNGIEYWAECGTALGIARHKGLIPWDDDIDIQISQEMSEKLFSLKNQLKECGLEIEKHWLGAKIFPSKNHPLGMIHKKDGCYFKTPSIDVFFMEKVKENNEEIYRYSQSGAKRTWPKNLTKLSEVRNEKGEQPRMQFGPIEVNGLWNIENYCKRQYGENCFDEAYMQYDHIKERGIESKLFRCYDKRAPLWKNWEGLKSLSNSNKSINPQISPAKIVLKAS